MWTASISGGLGSYHVSWDFGGAAEPNTPQQTVMPGSAAKIVTKMLNDSISALNGSVQVTVTDGKGATVSSSSQFTVRGVLRTVQITEVSAEPAAGDTPSQLLHVELVATPGIPATVILDLPYGAIAAPAGANVTIGADGTADVSFELKSGTFEPVAGDVQVAVNSPQPFGGSDSETIAVNLAAPELAPDTLYAIPLKTQVSVGEPVRVVVATGPTAHPFLYMVGVRITAPQASGLDENYGYGSLNYGAPGGATEDVDGIWAQVGPTGGFLLGPDDIRQRVDAGGGLYGLDYDITPLGGHAVQSASGALFNVEVTFSEPGTWKLGFQDVNVVSRTYYQDANQAPDYLWTDITNDHPGIANSVTVTGQGGGGFVILD